MQGTNISIIQMHRNLQHRLKTSLMNILKQILNLSMNEIQFKKKFKDELLESKKWLGDLKKNPFLIEIKKC